ncbi:MAG: HAD family hydrolase [Rhodospirillales bacterium]|nr:HAD family hydrolase [Rhodospirillales bacterium]
MAESLERPEAVFFDWDGTLVDSFAFLHGAHNYTRAQFGIAPFSLEDFGRYFGQPREKLYIQLYGAENVEAAKGHFEAYVMEHHKEGLKPISGAQEVLEVLHRLGVPCGVVTNKKKDLVLREIENYGWDNFFISVVGAGEAESDKPSPAPLQLAIERMGLPLNLDKTWLVGDTDNDLACANALGCKTILILDGGEAANLLENYEVHMHQKNCQELREFLLQYDLEALKK